MVEFADRETSDRRLRHLVNVLRNVQQEKHKFNICTWADLNPVCGTTACAIGYAALDPVFQQEGLRMEMTHFKDEGEPFPVCSLAELTAAFAEDEDSDWEANPTIDGHSADFFDLANFFGIDHDDSISFFTARGYHDVHATGRAATAQDVIDKIEKLLAERE